jgi:hypothetical protein
MMAVPLEALAGKHGDMLGDRPEREDRQEG